MTEMWTKNNKPKEKLNTEQAKEKALNFLEYRAYSRKELFDKLKRYTTVSSAEEVMDMLEEANLIDDETYAYQCAHDMMLLRYYGPVRLRQELSHRGISSDIMEEAISRAEEEIGSSEERLEALVEKKYANLLKDEKNRNKIINSLFRLGYGYDMIKKTIYEVTETGDEFFGTE